ncbi:YceI family protein [Flavobacterium caseinilyticum]|uniref:YceI family protein n=1 Tax=Flavobacterium caseinilyticum TaxID=2541732 RepID=A0A4R5AXH4_9FLAO|nr:YceI family protein [Flavobacterium caseinilyticum]TDD76426.1 YceI family protein [Flavobacterium caseinilyticum]
MKKLKINQNIFLAFLLLFCSISTLKAQDSKVVLSESKLTVLGTSNVHDWEIEAKAMNGKSHSTIVGGVLKGIKSLDFTVEVEQLVSGRKGMDANTLKALNSKTYKNIQFKLVNVAKITSTSSNQYTVETQGDLTVSGVTKRINQIFLVKVQGSKTIFSGKTKIDMTQYNIKPPKALMGTIKTGAVVIVDFKVTYN